MDVVILRLPQNLGITGAMNAGLAALMRERPDYVARIDTGDFCTPDRFHKQLAYMDANPNIGILGSAVEFRIFDNDNKLTGSKVMSFPQDRAACAERLFLNSSVIHPAMLIRRECLKPCKAYSEDYPAAEDFDLLWRAHKAGFGLVNLPDTLLIKEETPGSISQKRRRRQVWSRLAHTMAQPRHVKADLLERIDPDRNHLGPAGLGHSRLEIQTREVTGERWSERQDSNLRPLTPQISALPGCATLRLGPACSVTSAERQNANSRLPENPENIATAAAQFLRLRRQGQQPDNFSANNGITNANEAKLVAQQQGQRHQHYERQETGPRRAELKAVDRENLLVHPA